MTLSVSYTQRKHSVQRLFVTPVGFFFQSVLAALVILFQIRLPGMMLLIGIFSVALLLCEDLLAALLPFLLMTLVAIQSNGNTAYGTFVPLLPVAALPVMALFVHFWRARPKLVWGEAAWGIFAVAVAITIGGVGVISPEEYFSPTALYHMLALGFGMVLVYVLFCGAFQGRDPAELRRTLTGIMLSLGCVATFMVFHHYAVHLKTVLHTHAILPFQWRNNVSTYLLFCLPFAFFQALQPKRLWVALVGLVFYAAMLLSGSRGGMLFGAVEVLLGYVLLLIFQDRRHRWRLIFLGAGVAVAGVLCLPFAMFFLRPTLLRLWGSLTHSEDEERMGLFRRALEDFRAHPMFGTGIGYMGNFDVHAAKKGALVWYHNLPLQVLGSLGIFGVLAYLYQAVLRFRSFVQRNAFHMTLSLVWLGTELMSLVNPGLFAPIPYLMLLTIFLAAGTLRPKEPLI